MDASTFTVRAACALRLEAWAVRNLGVPAVRVGMRCRLGAPEGRVIAVGVAGGLIPGLKIGSRISANHIVNEEGETIWRGKAIKIPGAIVGKVVSTRKIYDSRKSREALFKRTDAIAVEMESHALVGPMYQGCVRTISDTPEWPLIFSMCGGLKALLELRKIRLETELW